MWFLMVKYRHARVYKTLRTRSNLVNILLFFSNIPFRSWKDIQTIKIERIKSNETSWSYVK